MIQRTDHLFMQEQLKELWIAKSAFYHCPALLGNWPETPDQDHYNSTWEDAEDDESDGRQVQHQYKRGNGWLWALTSLIVS